MNHPRRGAHGRPSATLLTAVALLMAGMPAMGAAPASAAPVDASFESSFEASDPAPDWTNEPEIGPDGEPRTSGVTGRTGISLRVTVPADTPDGTYDVTVAVRDERGNEVTRVLPVRVVTASCEAEAGSCPQDLTGIWNHDGVATLEATDDGNFDGSGWSFPAEQLPTAGLAVVGGRAYLMPSTEGDASNFVEARGQVVPLRQDAYPALDVVASAHNGDVDATATATYADGSSEQVALRVTDWAAGSPRFGEEVAIRTDYRVRAGSGRDAPPVALWHVVVPLDADREVVSLTLPDDERMEIYAVSGRNN